MIEFIGSITTITWVISFYVYMGICTGIAGIIITQKFNGDSLAVAIFWPITVTICSLAKIIKQ